MKQHSHSSSPQISRSNAGQAGKNGKQLTPPVSPLKSTVQMATDKKKKGPVAAMKKEAQIKNTVKSEVCERV